MHRKSARPTYQVLLPCLVVCLAMALGALAKNSRNFAGDYRILHVTEKGDSVEVQISLRVINVSGEDVKDATISLRSSLRPIPRGDAVDWEKEQPTFKGLTLNYNEHNIVPPLEATFTIPAREYDLWRKGNGPNFIIDYHDALGAQRRERLALAPRV
jgi:hypothetical protein